MNEKFQASAKPCAYTAEDGEDNSKHDLYPMTFMVVALVLATTVLIFNSHESLVTILSLTHKHDVPLLVLLALVVVCLYGYWLDLRHRWQTRR
jgi:hypothetical protein